MSGMRISLTDSFGPTGPSSSTIRRLPGRGDLHAGLDRRAAVVQFEPGDLPQRFPRLGLGKQRGRLECDDPHPFRTLAPIGYTAGQDGGQDRNHHSHPGSLHETSSATALAWPSNSSR